MTSHLVKLRDVQSAKNIPAPSYYSSQISHCPLHTARRITEKIKGSATLVAGIAECAFYMKNTGSHGDKDSSLFSVVLDWHDVTFGCTAKLEAAFDELMQEHDPKAVFLVTTCVPEITGDDVDSLAESFHSEYGITVAVVHTEHFKTMQESAGAQNALGACIELMKPGDRNESVNILGQGKKDFKGTELSGILDAAGIAIGVYIPDCSVEELECAAKAKLNIVVDANAILLAERMEERFQIPYVTFDKHIDPQRVFEAYEHIFSCLNKTLPDAVNIALEEACKAIDEVRNKVSGTSFFCEGTEFPIYEFNAFLCEIGMVPQLIVTEKFPGKDSVELKTILQHSDPYVIQMLNQKMLQTMQEELKPERLFGGRRGGGRGKHKIKRNGFDAIIEFVSTLTERREEDTWDREHLGQRTRRETI